VHEPSERAGVGPRASRNLETGRSLATPYADGRPLEVVE
jgi:hypothetical protein